MIALLVYSSELRYLKKVITKDYQRHAKECDKFILFDRKLVRKLMYSLAIVFFFTYVVFLTFPFISNQEYIMVLPVQLPWTGYFKHPDYEINYIFSWVYATFVLFLLFGKILLFDFCNYFINQQII